MKDPRWQEAMDAEYKSLMENRTWDLVPLPLDRKTINCKWVYKLKPDGRYKARLVAKGYTQIHGIDYTETFAPVAKFASIRAILAIAAIEDLEIQQMDVKSAFLNGDLKEEVYIDQPEGYEVKIDTDNSQKLACKLRKTLYGLKQSPREWYSKIDTFLEKNGYLRSHADHSVYVNKEGSIVAVYVDDLIIVGKKIADVELVKRRLHNEFKMTDLGELKLFLGIEIIRNRKTKNIQICQKNYINTMLKKFGMENSKAVFTPVQTGTKLSEATDKPKDEKQEMAIHEEDTFNKTAYQQAVGSLMYVMVGTRPDLAFAVALVSKFCSNPSTTHWLAVKRIFRYLKGTANYGIEYQATRADQLIGYCDSDWGNDNTDRRSIGGYVHLLAGGAISWKSKKQNTVALSSTEAEYMATTQAAKEAIWLRQLLKDLGRLSSHRQSGKHCIGERPEVSCSNKTY
jgi:hypothetical protein